MVTYMPLLAQDSAKSIFIGGRINYCFSASRTEVAENLCLYYNQTFSYAISYGAVDQYANGSYRVHGDTVALSSKKAKSFIITAAGNPAIPKGKIKLLFKDLRRNAAFVTMGAQDDSVKPDHHITLLKQSGNTYTQLMERPASGTILLAHTLYDKQQQAYALQKGKNEFTITISDSLGTSAFEDESFVWEDNSLRSVSGENTRHVFRTTGHPGYDKIPWQNKKAEITEDQFNEWSRLQEQALIRLNTLYFNKLAERARQEKENMQEHMKYTWKNALQKALQDTTGIIAFFGIDTSQIDNITYPAADTSGAGMDTLSEHNNSLEGKQYLVSNYYSVFKPDESGENISKQPVFYFSKDTSDPIHKNFRIAVLPAIVISSGDGNPLFKIEGAAVKTDQLRQYYSIAMQELENHLEDSIIADYKKKPKDSASLVKMIRLLGRSGTDRKTALEQSGITIQNILDTLASRYKDENNYSLSLYDFIASNYFQRGREDYFLGSQTAGNDPLTPAVEWLVNHFRRRQADTALAESSGKDSIIIHTYIQLTGVFSEAITKGQLDSAGYNRLLRFNQKLITGQHPFLDFYGSLSYFGNKFSLIKLKKIASGDFENELTGFLTKNVGIPETALRVTDYANRLYQSLVADKSRYVLREFGLEKTNTTFLQTITASVGYLGNLLAVAKMTKDGESVLSAPVIRKTGVLDGFKRSAELGEGLEMFLMKRNYAYVLYETGDSPGAIKLLEKMLNKKKEGNEVYTADEESIKKVKDNLIKMKAGEKISFRIMDMIAY